MAKLKIGDVAWTLDDGGIGIVCAVSDDGAFYRLNMHDGGQIDCGHLLVAPRPDLLPYGKPDAKWWEARLWRVACEERFGRKKYKGWYEVCLPNKRARPIEIPHGAPVPLPAAIRALRKLAIEYGMNIKIMEDER